MPALKRRAATAGLALLALGAAPAALAQDIDRIAGAPTPGGAIRAPEGVKVVAPGALVFASFDRDQNGVITADEIAAGAAFAFGVADRNGDGVITGFEQTDWAATTGSATDVMSNAMTFDIDLDRAVTQAEFIAGFKRIAGQIQPSGELTFADLVRPLTRNRDEAAPGPGIGLGTLTPRGSSQGSGRNFRNAPGD